MSIQDLNEFKNSYVKKVRVKSRKPLLNKLKEENMFYLRPKAVPANEQSYFNRPNKW